jgi:uroporphyrin-III C-methyltransferase/precorrin-2 dehydrogenase/sirohydrochlorin ferrochelatase
MDVLLSPPSEVPARIKPLAKLPDFRAFEGRRVVVAGGSDAAAWKAQLLAARGAVVDIYAEAPGQACQALLARWPEHAATRVVHHPRCWEAADLNGAALAVGDFEHLAAADRHCFCDLSTDRDNAGRRAS